jgi:hypothetical protein
MKSSFPGEVELAPARDRELVEPGREGVVCEEWYYDITLTCNQFKVDQVLQKKNINA